jgi:hypothetical protein
VAKASLIVPGSTHWHPTSVTHSVSSSLSVFSLSCPCCHPSRCHQSPKPSSPPTAFPAQSNTHNILSYQTLATHAFYRRPLSHFVANSVARCRQRQTPAVFVLPRDQTGTCHFVINIFSYLSSHIDTKPKHKLITVPPGRFPSYMNEPQNPCLSCSPPVHKRASKYNHLGVLHHT